MGGEGELTKCIKSDNLIFMKSEVVSVTEAARNFADCVNRAYYQKMSFILLKNGKPVARLVPEKDAICTGRDLAEAVRKAQLPESEARAWHKDLVAARKRLRAPGDKWQ